MEVSMRHTITNIEDVGNRCYETHGDICDSVDITF